MRRRAKFPVALLVLGLLQILLEGCGSYLHQPMQPSRARIGEEAPTHQLLKQLPPPKEPIVAAVYKFQDQTGAYQLSETGGSFNTAVTQGTTTILMRALEESGWFVPIERENISNLMNERQLIQSSHLQYNPNTDPNSVLPPLLFAGVLLEGGIVSYDANIITGGAGLRYFGMGGAGQYRQDRVTVYLRAVSTNTGKVLKTVYTSKTVLSQTVDVGVFRFVSFKRLLEFETGFTTTEPAEMVVTEAIEKAVQVLILEGLEEGLWESSNPQKAAQAIEEYRQERKEMYLTDLVGRKQESYRSPSSFGVQFAGSYYVGDYPSSVIKPGIDLNYAASLSPWWSLSATAGFGAFGTREFFDSKASYLDLNASFRLLPFDRYTPYFSGGLGLLFTEDEEGRFDLMNKKQPKLNFGFGMEFMTSRTVGLDLGFHYSYPLNDRLDNVTQGKLNDYYWQLKAGLRVYVGRLFGPSPLKQ